MVPHLVLIRLQPPAILISETITNPACNDSYNGSVEISISGGTPGYTYSDDGVNFTSNSNFSNLAGGNYTYWVQDASGCQVQLAGTVRLVSDEAADAYFSTRDRMSQIGAWASDQSAPLESREALMERFNRLDEKFEGAEVPRPPHWADDWARG